MILEYEKNWAGAMMGEQEREENGKIGAGESEAPGGKSMGVGVSAGEMSFRISRAAMLAAVYAALTFGLGPISYGPLQFRVAEALTVLPRFYPEAVPGLFVGCLIANLLGGYGILDIVFGSLATLAAALASRWIKNFWFVPFPPVVINALVIGAVLSETLGLPFLPTAAEIGLGQAGACYLLGLPLLYLVARMKKH